MRYKPENNTPLELLTKAGFVSTSPRGYQLPIGNPKHTDEVLKDRMHAYIEGDEIDYHHDRKGKGKTHVASSYDLRCKALQQVFKVLDGKLEKLHPHNRFGNKFPLLKQLQLPTRE